jgi:drug/metabolite transporter (DMT)-like permease
MRISNLASLTVVGIGAGWGLYWVPLRQLDAVAAAGAWATLIVVAVGTLALAPFGWAGRFRLAQAKRRALMSIALGGASFVLYSDGLLYGHVASVILLFYLTPIWSTLIARWWLRWPISWWRYAAIAAGLIGIALVLGGKNQGLPVPASIGDWLGLASGLLWAVASTGMHVHVRTRPAETNFIFCAGAAVMALVLALLLAPQDLPSVETGKYLPALGWTLILGVGWWAVSLTAFMWATSELEPPRIGILLMSEVVVGTLSAALFANEPFGIIMTIGAMLVVGACVLETMPERRQPRSGPASAPR